MEARLRTWGGQPPPGLAWHGHVHAGAAAVVADSRHRPQDLRAPPGHARIQPPQPPPPSEQQQQQQQQEEEAAQQQAGRHAEAAQWEREEERERWARTQRDAGGPGQQAAAEQEAWAWQGVGEPPAWVARLMVGSAIAAEARAAVKAETGFRSSAGGRQGG